MSEEKPDYKLRPKQQIFVDEYLQCFNAAEAARRAGYSEKTAREIGRQLLTNLDVKNVIDARLRERHMSADEAIARLADMARGDIGAFIDPETGKVLPNKNTSIIKRIKHKTHVGKFGETHEVEFELYSAKDAIDTILKVGGRLKDSEIAIKVELTDD